MGAIALNALKMTTRGEVSGPLTGEWINKGLKYNTIADDHTKLKAPYISHIESSMGKDYSTKTLIDNTSDGQLVQTQIFRNGEHLLTVDRVFTKDGVKLDDVMGRAENSKGEPSSLGALEDFYKAESEWMRKHVDTVITAANK